MKSFSEVFEDKTKYGFKIKTDEYKENGRHIIVDQGQEQIAGFTDLEEGIFEDVPAIIFGDHTRVIKYIDTPFFLGADGVKILKCKLPNANHKYLYYALKNANIPNTGYNRHFKWLKKISIVYPDIEKQKHIVETLDKISAIIESRKQELQTLDELIKARFVEMFGDPNTNGKKWHVGKILDVGQCVAGATPSTSKPEYWENGTIPWLSSGEVNKGRVYETDTKITQLGYDNASTKMIPPKTVILAMAGQGKTRGTAAITEIELCTNQSICSIVNNEKINPEYLLVFLKMQYKELRNASTSSEGRGGLNLKIIGNYPIIIPPIELQNKFAEFVQEVDKSKVVVQKAIDEAQLLFDSLMQEYFG